MQQYIARWGSYDVVYLCSCGEPWDSCDFFWAHSQATQGSNLIWGWWKNTIFFFHKLEANLLKIRYWLTRRSHRKTLKMIIDNHARFGLSLANIHIVFAIKDVRSFVASMAKKEDHRPGLISAYRSFNYWVGANEAALSYLAGSGLSYTLNLYEDLCREPDRVISSHLSQLGLRLEGELSANHNNSHIVMGNKNFILRNRSAIQYDTSWFYNDQINFVYLLHGRARKLNRKILNLVVSEDSKSAN